MSTSNSSRKTTQPDPAYGKGVADPLAKLAAGEPSRMNASRRSVAGA
jgi:hypothetical protein